MSDSKPEVQIGTVPAPEGCWIKVTPSGPYEVHGAPSLHVSVIETNAQGISTDYATTAMPESQPVMYLCRCGESHDAPFCDGSHAHTQHDLTETAPFTPLLDAAQEFVGPRMALTDNTSYCAFARFCDAGQRVWNEVQLAGPEHEALTLHMVSRCPGGRLMAWDKETGQPIEPAESPQVHLIEDPAQGCSGPIMARGGIRVESADGASYEVRNRQALCRCGCSSNKPFCDGTHAAVKYRARSHKAPEPARD